MKIPNFFTDTNEWIRNTSDEILSEERSSDGLERDFKEGLTSKIRTYFYVYRNATFTQQRKLNIMKFEI